MFQLNAILFFISIIKMWLDLQNIFNITRNSLFSPTWSKKYKTFLANALSLSFSLYACACQKFAHKTALHISTCVYNESMRVYFPGCRNRRSRAEKGSSPPQCRCWCCWYYHWSIYPPQTVSHLWTRRTYIYIHKYIYACAPVCLSLRVCKYVYLDPVSSAAHRLR